KALQTTISDVKDLRFEFNATRSIKEVSLDQIYVDVNNNFYKTKLQLQPFTSVVLIPASETPKVSTSAKNQYILRINAGGPDFNFENEEWKADQYYTGGSIYSRNSLIKNTDNDLLYQSERNGNFTYEVPVPEDGFYMV